MSSKPKMRFMPDPITPSSRLWKHRMLLPKGKSIYWSYKTFGKAVETDYNAGCNDVSKRRVQDVMKIALGYSQRIDPLSYKKPFVEKSNLQFRHDGVIHRKPTRPKKNKVYEIFMDNSIEYRYFHCRTGKDFYVVKYRKAGDFSLAFDGGHVVNEEIDDLKRFCKVFGMDFGELDVLVHMGKLYVIDVNNMPGNGQLFNKISDGDLARELYIEQIKSL